MIKWPLLTLFLRHLHAFLQRSCRHLDNAFPPCQFYCCVSTYTFRLSFTDSFFFFSLFYFYLKFWHFISIFYYCLFLLWLAATDMSVLQMWYRCKNFKGQQRAPTLILVLRVSFSSFYCAVKPESSDMQLPSHSLLYSNMTTVKKNTLVINSFFSASEESLQCLNIYRISQTCRWGVLMKIHQEKKECLWKWWTSE